MGAVSQQPRWHEARVIIFDCNGVLVDSEEIAAAVVAEELTRARIAITPQSVVRHLTGRRPADMFAMIEEFAGSKLPANFGNTVAAATMLRLRTELRAMPHAGHALTWLRGPKCVASSSPHERIQASLEATGLAKFFKFLFSATEVPNGKPAPDLFLHAASRMGVQAAECIVIEDSAAGVSAATAAGMTAVGFVGGSHAGAELGAQLKSARARTVIADLRHLKSTVVALSGW